MAARPGDRASLLARSLIVAIAVLLALLVIRNAVVLVGRDIGAPLGLSNRVWPPDATLTLIDGQLTVPQIDWSQRSEPKVMAAALRARRVDPLSEWPFALKGMVADRRGQTGQASALLERARERNRRGVVPAYLVLLHNAKAGNIDAAIADLVALLDRWPEFSAPLMPALIGALREEGTQRLSVKLRQYPDVRDNLVVTLSELPGSEALLLDLLADPNIQSKQRLEAINRLALRGRHDIAYPMWSKLLGGPPAVPFDPDFQGIEAPTSYGWNVQSGSTMAADFAALPGETRRAMDVEAFSDSLVSVGGQVMPIPPGAHSLTITGNVIEDGPPSGRMRWVLKCVASGEELARQEFSGPQPKQSRTLRFVVPAQGCPYQLLELFLVPDDSKMNYRMRFTGIRLDAGAT